MTTKELRNTVAATANGMPTLSEWLDRASAVSELREAVAGIYCGADGSIREPVGNGFLVMGWHAGRVEFAYLS